MALPMRSRPTTTSPSYVGRRIRQAAHDDNPETTPFAPNWLAAVEETPPSLTLARAGRIRLVISHVHAQSVPTVVYRAVARCDYFADRTTGQPAAISKTEGTPPTPLCEWRSKNRKAKDMSDLTVAVYRGMSETPIMSHTVTFESLCHALATHEGVQVAEGVLLSWDDVRTILLGFYAPAICEPRGMTAVVKSPAYQGIKKVRVAYNQHGHKKTMWQIALAFGSKTILLQETDPAAVWADAAKVVWKEFNKEPQDELPESEFSYCLANDGEE